MIKDTGQKIKAVRYCVAIGIVPQLEVVVQHQSDVSDIPADITDIDVLGIQPASHSSCTRVIFDCKTSNKMSPVNRAIWARGLMSLATASEAFVILTRPAPEGHRLAAHSLGVRLFSEAMFDAFAASVSQDYLVANSYLEQPHAWDSLLRLRSDYPQLRDYIGHLSSAAPLQAQASAGFRALMGRLKRVHGELDPQKAGHRALFFWSLCQALYYLSDMVREFHGAFDPAMGPDKFSRSLRHYVWGGRESYLLRKRLRDAITSSRGEHNGETLEFPAWPTFVEAFRSLLDAPMKIGACCLPMKDLAFKELSTPVPQLDERLVRRMEANNRIRQFSLLVGAYLVEAAGLPKEFGTTLTGQLTTLKA